jgi:ribose transport system permease protein
MPPVTARLLTLLQRLGPLLALILLVTAVSLASEDFRKPENFFNIVNQWSFVGLVAIGMTAVIILGGIDLSVGSMVALLGGLGIYAMNWVAAKSPDHATVAIAAAASLMLVGGIILGLINGGVIVLGRVAPFIVTVGTMAIFRSVILYAAEGAEVRSSVPSFGNLGSGGIELPLHSSRGMPILLGYPSLIFIAVAVVSELILRKTVLGRRILAVGDNATAARYAGVPISRITLVVYAFTGLTCGLSALLNSSRLNSISSSSTGLAYELDAIAAVVIGGTAMTGGRGSILGTVVGVLLLGVISNMLTMLGIENYIQGVVKGCIIIGAVLIQRGRRQA